MLDLSIESPLSLAQAARLIPPTRRGRQTHLSTVLRWVLRGAKSPAGDSVRLEAVRLGGRWVTSRQAIQRFAEALTPALDTRSNSWRVRSRPSARVERELDRLGI
jgi:hypothetical protein